MQTLYNTIRKINFVALVLLTLFCELKRKALVVKNISFKTIRPFLLPEVIYR